MLIRVQQFLLTFILLPAFLMMSASAQEADESGYVAQATGEAVGSAISTVPGTVTSFFAGIGEGAGVHGILDWAALLIGISFLISVFRGIKRGRIVGPAVRGLIGVALMGWAVS